jgi:predicted P-loop ATPase
LQDWKPCDENVVNGMTIEARLAGFDVRDKDVRRYVRSNLIRRSDPIDDYLAKVSGKWDGVTDHIGMLARCVPCDVPQWEEWFRKWFVSMVAQWLLPQQDYGNAIVPLLISPQGDGKTSFCRMILPKELRWGFLENLDVGQKRQTLQAMHNFLLINLDEFNQISPKLQEGFLKNVIQLPSVKIKRPYGKHVEEFKRYASFIATTNDQQVLSDPTGSRRFICVQLTAPVRTDYKPNYEGLYGQAYTIITERRMKWYFEPQDLKDVMANNSAFQLVPFTMHLFYEHYDLVEDELQGTWLTVATIFERLRALVGSSLSINSASSLGRILSNIEGIRRKRTKTGIAYLVKEKQQPLP